MTDATSFNVPVGIHPDDSLEFLRSHSGDDADKRFDLVDELGPTAVWTIVLTGESRDDHEVVLIQTARGLRLTADFDDELCRIKTPRTDEPDLEGLDAMKFILRPASEDGNTYTLETYDEDRKFHVRYDQEDKRLRLDREPDHQSRFSIGERHSEPEVSSINFFTDQLRVILNLVIESGFFDDGPAVQTSAERQALLERFAPRIYFHLDEKNFSSSVEFYTERVYLMENNKVDMSRHPTFADLALLSKDSRDEIKSLELFAPPDPVLRAGQDPSTNPPCYAHLKNFGDFTDIQYWFFFPYNGRPHNKTAGTHEGDWEHVTVRIDTSTQKVLEILGSRHAHGDTWYLPEDLERASDDHYVLYTALGTHAFYDKVGRHRSVACRDFTGKSSMVWDCWKHVIEVQWSRALPTLNGQDWIKFAGRWGQSGRSPTNISVKPAFKNGDKGSLLRLHHG